MVKLGVHLASWETVVTSPPRLTLAVAKGHTTGMEEQTAGSRASRTLALLLWSSAMVLALASVVLLLLNRAVLHGPEDQTRPMLPRQSGVLPTRPAKSSTREPRIS